MKVKLATTSAAKTALSTLAGLTALALAAAPAVAGTGVISACVNNASGALHIITNGQTCAGNESELSWNSSATSSVSGTGGPQVIDANSAVLGTFIDTDVSGFYYSLGFVHVSENGSNFLVPVSKDGFAPQFQHFIVFFSGPDCTGTAYVDYGLGRALAPVAEVFAGTAYYQGADPVTNVAYNSYAYGFSRCYNYAGSLSSGYVAQTADLSGFSAPFHLQQ